jgi:hypothetical protein
LPTQVSPQDPAYINRPNIDGAKFFVNGEIRPWTGKMQEVYAPIFLEGTEEKVSNPPQKNPRHQKNILDAKKRVESGHGLGMIYSLAAAY